ncbi:MAG: amylo-alpha-1,6-glucosidase [Acetobacteraceae bacterium]
MGSDPLRFGRAICGDLKQAERREWWLANGRGGYAAGTIAGTLTRRYHGLLVAAVDPPLGRRLVFAKADATLLDGANSYPLFANRWSGGEIAPPGNLGIESFFFDYTVPVWIYAVGGHRVEARIWMEPGEDATWLAWRKLPSAGNERPLRLRVTLLANNRDHNGQTSEDGFRPEISVAGNNLSVADGARFTLMLALSAGTITADRVWYRNFELPVEARRGLGADDAHLCIGHAEIPLHSREWSGVVASLRPNPSADPGAALERRRTYDTNIIRKAGWPVAPHWINRLLLAADSFVFARPLPEVPDGQSVIAGYPWFGDWGRDTMISLPGLTVATGRPKAALRILETFSRFVSEGMLPNVFPGIGDRPEYNTADASLWYFEAWRAYVAASNDLDSLRAAFPVLADMIGWHHRGTRYGIGVDAADGLLRAGERGVQLTWMDAKVGDWVVTPRIGKPVEINALWYNALRIMADFAATLGGRDDFTASADTVRAGFRRFRRPDGQGLFDAIDGPDGDDSRIRPNQIFAVSLPHSPLSKKDQAAVVAICRQQLLTSYGLRSLAPGDAGYHPRYGGDVRERDGGYHQGAVWGWLLGHFALAVYHVTGDRAAALELLDPMQDALADQGLGTIGEIFDGDPPHDPRGAPSQAWSVACTLQAWDILQRASAEPKGA